MADTTPKKAPARRTAKPKAPAGPPPLDRDELDRLVGGAHHNPHGILGAHPVDGATVVLVDVDAILRQIGASRPGPAPGGPPPLPEAPEAARPGVDGPDGT